MKLTVANSKEFGRLLDGLGDDVVDAAIHFRLHKDLRESVKNFERELNQSPAFWSLTFGAHIDATRSRLFRVYASTRTPSACETSSARFVRISTSSARGQVPRLLTSSTGALGHPTFCDPRAGFGARDSERPLGEDAGCASR